MHLRVALDLEGGVEQVGYLPITPAIAPIDIVFGMQE